MPVTILDLVVVGVVLISALLAAVRGLTREVLAIASWVAAAAVAWVFHPQLLPLAKQYIPNDTIALIASIAALFLVTLIVVSLVTARISDFVLDSRIGALDRTLGFVFGAGRGLLLAVVGYLFFSALLPEKNLPSWAKDARARPILEETGRSLLTMLPQDINSDMIKKMLKPKTGEEPTEAPAEEPRAPANPTADPQRRTQVPNANDKQALQRVIEAGKATTPAQPRP
ncbi:membrane protein required for colicin V production [Bosea sp. BE125]|jgi:membrane protein required for colicin V production|uniref:CvpA family protein n=1 Tax=Bosea sp. BE125 TaxID=2817909 RepID=UPI00285C8B96|nr:CvpA family protein [Bosea sp. BE125]MDR6870247.1 membrane protein required for colicin V production [Bosea sp. BE125]